VVGRLLNGVIKKRNGSKLVGEPWNCIGMLIFDRGSTFAGMVSLGMVRIGVGNDR